MEKDEYGRLTALEKQMETLVNSVSQLSQDLRTWRDDFVPRKEIDIRFDAVHNSIHEIRLDLKEAATSKDITEIKQVLAEMKNDKRSNLALYATWAGVAMSLVAVVVAIVAIIAN